MHKSLHKTTLQNIIKSIQKLILAKQLKIQALRLFRFHLRLLQLPNRLISRTSLLRSFHHYFYPWSRSRLKRRRRSRLKRRRRSRRRHRRRNRNRNRPRTRRLKRSTISQSRLYRQRTCRLCRSHKKYPTLRSKKQFSFRKQITTITITFYSDIKIKLFFFIESLHLFKHANGYLGKIFWKVQKKIVFIHCFVHFTT